MTLRHRWVAEAAHGLIQSAFSDNDRGRVRTYVALGQLTTVNARERGDGTEQPDKTVAGCRASGREATHQTEPLAALPCPIPGYGLWRL